MKTVQFYTEADLHSEGITYQGGTTYSLEDVVADYLLQTFPTYVAYADPAATTSGDAILYSGAGDNGDTFGYHLSSGVALYGGLQGTLSVGGEFLIQLRTVINDEVTAGTSRITMTGDVGASITLTTSLGDFVFVQTGTPERYEVAGLALDLMLIALDNLGKGTTVSIATA